MTLDPVFFWLAQIIAISVLLVSGSERLTHALLLIVAVLKTIARPRAPQTRNLWQQLNRAAPPVTLIVPAHNEELTIIQSVRSLLSLQYPAHTVIVVNDGSSDRTLESLLEAFDLQPDLSQAAAEVKTRPVRGVYAGANWPNLVVIDKVNGGKADALNAGLGRCATPLVCAVDADSVLEGDSLLRAVQPFIDDPVKTVAVGGTVRVANGCRVSMGRVREVALPQHFLARLQTIEYLRAFVMARLAWEQLGALVIVSGAFGVFRRDLTLQVGGWSADTVGEDLELIVRMHRHLRQERDDYAIRFVPEPVCWTQVPETLSSLAKQRMRWQRGALESLVTHANMWRDLRHARVTWLGLGHLVLIDLVAPIVEVAGYLLLPFFLMMGVINWPFFLAWISFTIGFGIFISLASLIFEEAGMRRLPRVRDLAILTGIAIVENFGYRQLANWWRIRGLWQWLRGAKHWGKATRRGFLAQPQEA